MASKCHEDDLIAGAPGPLDGLLARDRDGHASSGALPPESAVLRSPPGVVAVPVPSSRRDGDPQDAHETAAVSLGRSVVGGAGRTAAASPTMAHGPRSAGRSKVPGRTSRPQAVPPRPGVRESDVMATIDRALAALLGVGGQGGGPGDGAADPCRTPVARASTLAGDVALEGFELVALADALTRAYAPEADVLGWFAELDVDDLAALTAGHIADFVVWCHGVGRLD